MRSWVDQVDAFKAAVQFSLSRDSLDHVIINAGVFDMPFFLETDKPMTSLDDDPVEPDATPVEVNTKGAMYTLKLAQLYMPMPSSTSPSPDSKSVLFFLSPEA